MIQFLRNIFTSGEAPLLALQAEHQQLLAENKRLKTDARRFGTIINTSEVPSYTWSKGK